MAPLRQTILIPIIHWRYIYLIDMKIMNQRKNYWSYRNHTWPKIRSNCESFVTKMRLLQLLLLSRDFKKEWCLNVFIVETPNFILFWNELKLITNMYACIHIYVYTYKHLYRVEQKMALVKYFEKCIPSFWLRELVGRTSGI